MFTTPTAHEAYLHAVEALNELAEALGEPKLVPENQTSEAPTVYTINARAPREKPGFDFNFPETGWRKQAHPGTMRAAVLDMLLKGTTFAEVEEAVANMSPTTKHTLRTRTFRLIRDMHYRLGYKITGDPGDTNPIKAYPLNEHSKQSTSCR